MRFLLDTNILIPLEDSKLALASSLANLVKLAYEHGHHLLYHPASQRDIERDPNPERRARTLERLAKYERLVTSVPCPWNGPDTSPNDAVDNEILYALERDAVHALITEDREIHDKARSRGLSLRIYTIQTAEDWLRRLHERAEVRLPNIEDIPLHDLSPLLSGTFFDGLREAYDGFDDWFRGKARDGRCAWVYWEDVGRNLGAICIYDRQDNVEITDDGKRLSGPALKLCTFKVGENCRGRKIGELFLKMAFRYATANRLVQIFIHANRDRHHFLLRLLEDFGFQEVGSYRGDTVYVKPHPIDPPCTSEALALPPLEYHRRYFPHYRLDAPVRKFVIPIKPEYHRILFPDYVRPSIGPQLSFSFEDVLSSQLSNSAGNAIKLAYLCHAQSKSIKPGDVVLFYRSGDERAITSLGVVECFKTLSSADEIARLVRRRTVYSLDEIEDLAKKPTRVILFRLVRHFNKPIPHNWLLENRVVNGNIRSIRAVNDASFKRILNASE